MPGLWGAIEKCIYRVWMYYDSWQSFWDRARIGPGRDLAQRGGGAEKMDSGSPRLSLSAR